MDPWKPEFEVTRQLAQSLIGTQFPELAPVRLRAFASGWDNIVFQVNDTLLFRFPQRQVAVDGVEREIRCLPFLKARLGLVPELRFIGAPGFGYPWPFFGYVPVEGQELTTHRLDRGERRRVAQELGGFLRQLHSISKDELGPPGLPRDPLGRLDFSKRIPMAEERLRSLEAAGIALPYGKLKAVLHEAAAVSRTPREAVVHGDLHFRHVILSEDRRFKGLIDWGDLHLNDPAIDLQLFWSFLQPDERPEFLAAYGNISDSQSVLARSFAIFVNSALWVSALDMGQSEIAQAAKGALEAVLAE